MLCLWATAPLSIFYCERRHRVLRSCPYRPWTWGYYFPSPPSHGLELRVWSTPGWWVPLCGLNPELKIVQASALSLHLLYSQFCFVFETESLHRFGCCETHCEALISWPQTQRFFCLCFPSADIQGVGHHAYLVWIILNSRKKKIKIIPVLNCIGENFFLKKTSEIICLSFHAGIKGICQYCLAFSPFFLVVELEVSFSFFFLRSDWSLNYFYLMFIGVLTACVCV